MILKLSGSKDRFMKPPQRQLREPCQTIVIGS
jgi:hypothetical protein